MDVINVFIKIYENSKLFTIVINIILNKKLHVVVEKYIYLYIK